MSVHPAARRARAWMLGTLLATLAAGFVLGASTRREAPRPPTYLEQLTDALDLRPEQVARLEGLLADEDRDIDRWLEESLSGLRERVAARRERTEGELLAALDPDQRARYQRLAAGAGGAADGAGSGH